MPRRASTVREIEQRLHGWLDRISPLPGSGLPTVRELAEMLQATRSTIHQALRSLEQTGVIRAEPDGSRVVAARQQAAVDEETVVLISAYSAGATAAPGKRASNQQQLFAGACAALAEAGLRVLTLPPGEVSLRALAQVVVARPLGFLLFEDPCGSEEGRQLLRGMIASGRPVVVFGDHLPRSLLDALPVDQVCSDHQEGARQLVHVLAARERRRLLPVIGTMRGATRRNEDYHWFTRRLDGYRQGCVETGLELLPIVSHFTHPLWVADAGLFAEQVALTSGFLAPHLLATQPPDAIAVISDGMVADAAAACRLFGQVPGRDLDIVGYDHYWSHCPLRHFESYRPQASVDQEFETVGRGMVDVLRERITAHPALPRIVRMVGVRLVGDHQPAW